MLTCAIPPAPPRPPAPQSHHHPLRDVRDPTPPRPQASNLLPALRDRLTSQHACNTLSIGRDASRIATFPLRNITSERVFSYRLRSVAERALGRGTPALAVPAPRERAPPLRCPRARATERGFAARLPSSCGTVYGFDRHQEWSYDSYRLYCRKLRRYFAI